MGNNSTIRKTVVSRIVDIPYIVVIKRHTQYIVIGDILCKMIEYYAEIWVTSAYIPVNSAITSGYIRMDTM